MPNIPQIAPSRARSVELLVFADVQLLDLAGPLQAFATANDLERRAGRPAPYLIRVVADGGSHVATSSGVSVMTEPLSRTTEPVDTLIVAGGNGVYAAAADAALTNWLSAKVSVARRVASVCSGAFLLAETGLLDGLRVATHWSRCEALARRHPALKVEPDPIFIQEGRVWTSAGVTAGIDLALALLEEDAGRALALDVARHLVVFLKRPGGQSQFSAALALQGGGQPFDRLHAWMADHPTADLSLDALAKRAGMSQRSFVRRYRAATGQSPGRAVERLRVEAARRMLEEGLPVKRAAARAGFGSDETMRRSFVRLVGVAPQDYRGRFSIDAPRSV